MIEFKRLSEVSLGEATAIWNKGFEDYEVKINHTIDSFTYRLGAEELSSEYSLVAYVEGEPAGIVLNGIRDIRGTKVSWNGGTAVAKEFRGTGVGRKMIEKSIELYKHIEVEVAMLEALSGNKKAIALYEKMGYEIVDRLHFLKFEGPFKQYTNKKQYQFRKALAQEAAFLPMVNKIIPWQTQWQSLRKDGELLVISESGVDVGYVLYKKIYDHEGNLKNIVLYQAGVNESNSNPEEVINFGLNEVFSMGDGSCVRMTFNLPSKNKIVYDCIKELGFIPFNEQVFMKKNM